MAGLSPLGWRLMVVAAALALAALLMPDPANSSRGAATSSSNSTARSCPYGFTTSSPGHKLPAGHPPVRLQPAAKLEEQLILWHNGTVWTGDSQLGTVEALLLDAQIGIVIAAGSALELRNQAKAMAAESKKQGASRLLTERDLNGAFLMPGFIDPHTHFLQAGLFLSYANLWPATSKAHFQRLLAEHVESLQHAQLKTQPSLGHDQVVWVQGGQWDEGRWGGTLPDKTWLDEVTGTDLPAVLSRADSHMAVANSAALRLAGITAETPDPPGGHIDKDAHGEPTGIVREQGVSMVRRLVPPPTQQQRHQALQAAIDYALSRGVTSVVDLGRAPYSGDLETTWQDLEDVYMPAADAGALRIRIMAFTPLKTWQRMAAHVQAHGRAHASLRLHYGGVKEFADGSLGSRTALMWKPYSDLHPSPSAAHVQAPSSNSVATITASVAASAKASAAAAVFTEGSGSAAAMAMLSTSSAALSVTVDTADSLSEAVTAAAAPVPATAPVVSTTHDQADCGTQMISNEDLYALAQGADAAGLTVAVHAIGDRAIDDVVDIFRRVRIANAQLHSNRSADLVQEGPAWFRRTIPATVLHSTGAAAEQQQGTAGEQVVSIQGPRHRIEHMQHISGPESARLAAQIGVAATPNPLHLVADGELMQRRLGSTRSGPGHSYAFRTLATTDITSGYSTDWPVTDLDPIAGVYTSVFRSDAYSKPAPVWGIEEALEGEQALAGHTRDAAYTALLEDYVGSLRPGLRADFVLLSSSPLQMTAAGPLPKVLSTFVDGQCAHGCSQQQLAAVAMA